MYSMTLFIGDRKIEVTSRDHLISMLEEIVNTRFNEVWIEGKAQSKLCVMTNESKAFFMYLRFDGDSGFRSNNRFADIDQLQAFKLSNGQTDEYPETWLADKDKVRDVILTYYDTGNMASAIEWVEEK